MSPAVLYLSDARFESAFWQILSSSLGIVSSVCRGGRGSVVVICSMTSLCESPRNGFFRVNNSYRTMPRLDENIGGLDVPVDQPSAVGVMQGVGDRGD